MGVLICLHTVIPAVSLHENRSITKNTWPANLQFITRNVPCCETTGEEFSLIPVIKIFWSLSQTALTSCVKTDLQNRTILILTLNVQTLKFSFIILHYCDFSMKLCSWIKTACRWILPVTDGRWMSNLNNFWLLWLHFRRTWNLVNLSLQFCTSVNVARPEPEVEKWATQGQYRYMFSSSIVTSCWNNWQNDCSED